MSSLFLNPGSSMQASQAKQLQEQVSIRTEQASDLQQVKKTLEKALTEMTTANQNAEALIHQLAADHPCDPVKTVTDLAQFVAEAKSGSVSEIYSQAKALNNKAKEIEAEAAALEQEVQHLQAVKARMTQLLRAKRETTELTQFARSEIEAALKKV